MMLGLGQGFAILDVDPLPVLSPLIAVEKHQIFPVPEFCSIENPDFAITLGSTLGIFLVIIRIERENKLKFNRGCPSALQFSISVYLTDLPSCY